MACTALIPENTVILQFPGSPESNALAYREEITHPALPVPRIAQGTLAMSGDGRMIRHQRTPETEIVEIGENFLRVRRGEDAEANLLPIPDRLNQIFSFLREITTSPDRTVELARGAERKPDPLGWISVLGVYEDETTVSLLGCGTRMVGFEVRTSDGVRRRTVFGPTQERSE